MTQARACVNADGSPKVAYRSKAAAEKAARRTNRDNRRDVLVLPYRCPNGQGHGWHLGHDGWAE